MAALTASVNLKLPSCVIGARSTSGSKPGFLNMKGVKAVVTIGANKMVLPSGSARTTASAAIRPPPPGRFSTTTVLPPTILMRSATTRAIESTPLPAAKPTMSFKSLVAAAVVEPGIIGRAPMTSKATVNAADRNASPENERTSTIFFRSLDTLWFPAAYPGSVRACHLSRRDARCTCPSARTKPCARRAHAVGRLLARRALLAPVSVRYSPLLVNSRSRHAQRTSPGERAAAHAGRLRKRPVLARQAADPCDPAILAGKRARHARATGFRACSKADRSITRVRASPRRGRHAGYGAGRQGGSGRLHAPSQFVSADDHAIDLYSCLRRGARFRRDCAARAVSQCVGRSAFGLQDRGRPCCRWRGEARFADLWLRRCRRGDPSHCRALHAQRRDQGRACAIQGRARRAA